MANALAAQISMVKARDQISMVEVLAQISMVKVLAQISMVKVLAQISMYLHSGEFSDSAMSVVTHWCAY